MKDGLKRQTDCEEYHPPHMISSSDDVVKLSWFLKKYPIYVSTAAHAVLQV